MWDFFARWFARRFYYAGKHAKYLYRVKALDAAEKKLARLMAERPGTTWELIDTGTYFEVKKASKECTGPETDNEHESSS